MKSSMMSEPTLFEYKRIPNEQHSAYTLEILNAKREVILTVPQVRAIHVQTVLNDDIAMKLIDMGYQNPQFAESL
jgi:hypothetical protein